VKGSWRLAGDTKAEAYDDHEEDSLKKYFASVVSFELFVMVP